MPEPTLNPTHSPTAAFKVTASGLESTQQEPNGLERFVVEVHLDMIGVARVSYNAQDFDASQFKVGDDVEVEVSQASIKTFKGNITGVSYSLDKGKETITVTAMDPLVKLANSSVTKVWGGKTTDKFKDSDLAKDIIGAGGCEAGTIDATAGERPYIYQRAESNLAFLKRLASRNGFLVYAEDGKVNFKKPQFSDSAKEIAAGDLIRVDVTRSDVAIPSSVKVFGWNYVQKKAVSGEAAIGDITAIGGGSPPSPTTYGGDLHIVDVFVDSDASAKAMAEGEMNRFARGAVRGSITVQANGELVPGTKVKLKESWKSFNAEGVVVGARHVVESGSSAQTTIYVVGNTEPE